MTHYLILDTNLEKLQFSPTVVASKLTHDPIEFRPKNSLSKSAQNRPRILSKSQSIEHFHNLFVAKDRRCLDDALAAPSNSSFATAFVTHLSQAIVMVTLAAVLEMEALTLAAVKAL